MELVNPKTGMTHSEAREFIRNHFEEFVNKKNVQVGNLNFAADFVDHGADVPPGMPPGPAGAIAYVSGALQKFPDLHVAIDDMIAEDDRVVVRNGFADRQEIGISRDCDLANCGAVDCGAVGVFGSTACRRRLGS